MEKLKEFLFTGFYSGYCPVAPGTAGTLVAMALYFLGYFLFGENIVYINVIVVLVLIYPSILLGNASEKFFNRKDPQEVVLDEMMGYWISVSFFRFDWKVALLAFVLFRIMDIAKPFPINRLQKLNAGLGIMIDDYIAGIYANIILFIILNKYSLISLSII